MISKPLHEVFDFFSKPENLEILTPPELHFKILTKLPVSMKKGSIIDYRIKLFGMPFKWKTEISEWTPSYRFADRQLKGPYLKWEHTHSFVEIEGITHMTDKVEYLSPGWVLEPFIDRIFVSRQVKKIFEYRESRLREIFS